MGKPTLTYWSNTPADTKSLWLHLKGDDLFRTNTHQKAKTDKLIPITTTLFKIDAQSQVELVKDDKGNFSGIKLYWDDGWVDQIQKKIDKSYFVILWALLLLLNEASPNNYSPPVNRQSLFIH